MEGGEEHAIDKRDAIERRMGVEKDKDVKVHITIYESSRLIFNGNLVFG